MYSALATYLVVDLLIEGLKGISETIGLQFFIKEHFLELGYHPVEDSCSNLCIDKNDS